MNRPVKGLRAFAASLAIAAIIPGGGAMALSLSAAASSTTMTATTAVNLRSGPGTGHARVGVLYKGNSVTAHGSSDGWTQVTWNGRTAYVASQYLTGGSATSGSGSVSSSSATGTVHTTANVNLRTGPSLASSVHVVAARGTSLSLTGAVSGSYSQVTYNGRTLWAATQYLTTGNASSSTGSAGGSSSQPSAPSTPSTSLRYATTLLNIWNNSSGSSYNGVYQRGAQVNITGRVSNGRAEVVHNGAIRWVTAKYLSTSPPSSSSGSSSSTGAGSGDINKGWSSGLDKVNPDATRIVWHVWNNYPQIKTMYGWRRDVTPDHPAGRAVDVMIPNYKTNKALGTEIANYFRANAKQFNISYIIWDQKIWSVARDREGWRAMASRGSDSANHKDHVHLNTY